MSNPPKEILPDAASVILEDWRERRAIVLLAVGNAKTGWGATASGTIERLMKSPDLCGIEFWFSNEGRLGRISFDAASAFRLRDPEGIPRLLLSDWHSFLEIESPDGRRILFAERHSV